jgi:hypothetical protein
LFHISNKRPADEGGGCSVPRRPGPAPEPNAELRVGVMGEAGDFKCLTFVKLKPRPVRKPGLFFRIKREPPPSVLGSLATALRCLHLQDFREGGTTRASGLLILHDLDVVPLAGSSQVMQSEYLLSQLRNLARLESCSSTVRPTRCYASTNRRSRRATCPAVCSKCATLLGNVDRADRNLRCRRN